MFAKRLNQVTKDFIYKSNSWKEFFNALKKEDTETKGDAFELLCFCFLSTDVIFRNLLNKVWHESDCPDEIYTKTLHLVRPEIGVDIICEDINGKYWAVQCKYRSPETDNLTYDEVSSFFDITERSKTKKHLSNRLIITSTLDLSERINQVHDDFNYINFGRLDDLEKKDFDNFRNFLDNKFKPVDKKNRFKPKPHQREAINNIKKDLVKNERSQAIMACGSGKTLVALWVKEELNYEQVLVLVPSLNLASQIIREWFMHKKIDFDAICICSDKSVTKRDKDENYDNWVNTKSEIEIPVKSQVNEIKYFLKTDKNKVIFCTYQSSPLIAEAMIDKEIKSFDITFCDEAHRCAGAHSKTFSLILDGKRIRSKKRLFLTATPKETDDLIKETAKAKGREVHSMDDEKKFGRRSHVLSFRDALHKYKKPILCDYRIIACEIYRSEVNKTYEQIKKRDFLSTDGQNTIDAETLASQIAIIKAIRQYNLKRIITFHTRRENALDFSKNFPEVYRWENNDQNERNLVCDYIDGQMSTHERKKKLKKLQSNESDDTIIFSNARCLQEGVDIKTLDGIVFIDPKKSFIDIIQAVGRVMRISPGKKHGTILIPVFLEDSDNNDKNLLMSRFSQVWRLAKALSRHDSYLLEKITELRISLGKRKPSSRRRSGLIIEDKIIIAERVQKLFSESIDLIVARNIIENWYEKYGELEEFFENNPGRRTIPNKLKDLQNWCQDQRDRFDQGKLSKARIKLLEKFEMWAWNLSDALWLDHFQETKEFEESNGHLFFHIKSPTYKWFRGEFYKYRDKDPEFDENKRNLFNSLETLWMIKEKITQTWFFQYKKVLDFALNGGKLVLLGDTDPKSYNWCNNQIKRHQKEEFSVNEIKLFDKIPNWDWKILDKRQYSIDLIWENNFLNLEQYERDYETTNVNHKTHEKLASWTWRQRELKNKKSKILTKYRIKRLESLKTWSWNALDSEYIKNFSEVKEFEDKNGHLFMFKIKPAKNTWFKREFYKYRDNDPDFDESRRNLFDSLETLWMKKEAITQTWFFQYKKVLDFALNGGKLVLLSDTDPKSYKWCNNQIKRHQKEEFSENLLKLFDKIPNWDWKILDSRQYLNDQRWEKQFLELEQYERDYETTDVNNKTHKKLATWTSRQKNLKNQKSKILTKYRIERLESLKTWTW